MTEADKLFTDLKLSRPTYAVPNKHLLSDISI